MWLFFSCNIYMCIQSENYGDFRHTCKPCNSEIPALRFPRKDPINPCKHLQCSKELTVLICKLCLEKSYLSQQGHWQFSFRSFSIFDGVELINFPDGQKYIWNSSAIEELSLKWTCKKIYYRQILIMYSILYWYKYLLTSTDLHIWSSW